ncbi:MAG: TolC family protein, partial [Vicinamibacteraceae bacterium]|nr:TolC family protein [Vicinamibacteraceae bacterium]
LNDPDPLSNYRSGLSIEQVLFDGGASWAGLRQASHGRADAALAREAVRQQLATRVTETFGGVLRLEGGLASARAAVEAANADLRLTTDRRDAGLVTDADVLAVAVHQSQMQEQVIRFETELAVARSALNELLGRPLDAALVLDDTLPAPADAGAAPSPPDEEAQALERRPDVRRADLGVSLAGEAVKAARAAFFPQVVFQGGYEVNGSRWTEGATNWMAGIGVRWNLFRGGSDWARLTEARLARDRAAITRDQAREQARLDVRAARARLAAARARLEVARRIVDQAGESQRILRDRYESGLVDVASLLRASQAVVAADAQALGARVDVIVSTAHLERALGR